MTEEGEVRVEPMGVGRASWDDRMLCSLRRAGGGGREKLFSVADLGQEIIV